MSAALSADRVQLQRFIDATFPYADRDSFVSLRCFRDDVDGIALRDEWRCVRVTGNADDLVDAAEDLATLAALDDAPIVFAPPVCSFKTADKADAANLANGLVITAELDSNPAAGRARLEAVLGPATVVVESGGLWLDPETGELLPKLHLHWRLEKPTRTPIEHDFLKEANQLATTLAGGDPTAVPLVHPLRWAGSWHRKATPRMARIVDGDITREIGLADALNKLGEAARALKPANGHDPAPPKDFAAFAPAELLDITAAIACIPNNDDDTPHGASWKQWNDMGLRIYAATGGSDVGLALWLDWSKRSKAFDEAETRARWRHYATNPPTKTNPGALFNLAKQHYKDFVRPSELRRQAERDANEPADWPPPTPFDPEPPAPPTNPTEPDLDALINRFNAQYAVVNEAGKVLVFEQVTDETLQRNVIVRFSFADLRRLYQNQKLTVTFTNADGKTVSTTRNKADWWLDHPARRTYTGGVVFDPTGKAPANCWNLWTGFSVKPEPGVWSLLRAHIHNVICSGNREHYDYLMGLLARLFQYPSEPAEVAIVMRGEEGVGKGILGRYLVRAFGQHGVHISSAAHLIGNFNAHLRDCVVLFADEAFYAGDKQHEGRLKALITEEILTIEGKYQNVVTVKNRLHVIMASNSDWVVPASLAARRWLALDVSDTRRGDLPYFSAIAKQMDAGGLAAMIHDLLNRDISTFGPRAVPKTDALIAQQLHSLKTLEQWWLAVLERGFLYKSRHGTPEFREWRDFYTTELLFRSYQQWCDETRTYRRQTRVELGQFLTKVYKSSRPQGEYPVYEIEVLDVDETDKAGEYWLNKYAIVRKEHPTGYSVGTLEEARVRFTEICDVSTEWGLKP